MQASHRVAGGTTTAIVVEHKSKGEGKKSIKVQSTSKIGFCCTAHMKVVTKPISFVW